MIGFVLVTAVVLQLLAALLALRLIRLTGTTAAWGLITTAILLMVARRIIPVYHIVTGDPSFSADPILEWAGLVISVCMVIGVARIAPLFRAATQSQKILASEKEWLTVTLRSIGDAVIATDANGRVKFLNGIAQSLTGWREDAIGKPLKEVFHIINENTRQPCEDPAAKVLQSGEIVGLANHTAILSRDGTERSIADSGAPIHDTIGNIIGVVLVFRDVTQQKQAEDALRQSEERFRLLVGSVKDYAIFMLDPEGRVASWNVGAEQIEGYTAEEILGRCFSCFYSPEDCDSGKPAEALRRAVAEGRFEDEGWRIRKNGSRLWVNVVITPVFDGAGILRGFAKVTRDITDRKRAEEALRFNEARLQALVQLNQMAGASLQEITDFALESAVALTDSKIGYLAFMNEDETVLTMHSWSKTAMAQCAIIDKPIVYQLVNTGLWGEAVRQRKPVITNDYQAPNPLKKGHPEGHVNVLRHMNAPIFDGDRIVIVAGVGNKAAPYDDSDVRQLTLLMQGMWQLIQRKRAGRGDSPGA